MTHPASQSSIRSIQKQSGLFDTGTTDAGCLASVESPTCSFTDEAIEDMFATLEKGEIPSVAPSNMAESHKPSTSSEAGELLGLDADFNLDDFGEVFTDLKQIIMMDVGSDEPSSNPTTVDLSELSCVETASDKKPLKRTAAQAFASIEHIPTVAYSDHDNYTVKVKCLKTEEETVMATTSEVLSSDQKYRERRRKNNIASQRSRATRKQKNTELQDKALQLANDNEILRHKVEKMEKLAKEMKDLLVHTLAQK